ncbi:hypothetical protein [Basilea psittacipulmonis]|uniref:Autotransporter domain-containing protein n=1 Tax=Basilea psittacipulmonis DSM 24701 TaxID=1072685 RepID=A0A077DF09_9BURK|nr:hypothetical protein [Basilea psittacipulmonis]AIL32017.1 hypothetical protein IX83_00575 [Basilea psittacipulmonis DSM 24701]
MTQRKFLLTSIATSLLLLTQPALANIEFEQKHEWTFIQGNDQWVLYGDTLKLDGTSTSNTSSESLYAFRGDSLFNVYGSGAKWDQSAYANGGNLTINLSDHATWYGPTFSPNGHITVNIEQAEWQVQGTSLTAARGANQFSRMVGHLSEDKAQAFILANPELTQLPSWASLILGNDFNDKINAIKNGDTSSWSDIKSRLQNNASLITTRQSRIIVSSFVDKLYLSQAGVLNLNTDGDTAAGLIINDLEANNGTIIINSDYDRQNLSILTQASGSLNILDQGSIASRGRSNQHPLIYYYGFDTPKLQINQGQAIKEKGTTAYAVKYYTAEETTSGIAGFYYTPAGPSNLSVGVQSIASTTLLANQIHQKSINHRATQLRQDQHDQGTVWIKPFYQDVQLRIENTPLDVYTHGVSLGADTVLLSQKGKYLLGMAVSTASSKP